MLTINQQIQEITKVNEITIMFCVQQTYIIYYSSLHKKRFYIALKKASYCTPPLNVQYNPSYSTLARR